MARKPQRIGVPGEIKLENVEIEPQIQESKDNVVSAESIQNLIKIPIYTVKITHPSLRHRAEPSVNGRIIGIITNRGIYGIFKEQDGWGQLEDESWIMLKFCQKIEK